MGGLAADFDRAARAVGQRRDRQLAVLSAGREGLERGSACSQRHGSRRSESLRIARLCRAGSEVAAARVGVGVRQLERFRSRLRKLERRSTDDARERDVDPLTVTVREAPRATAADSVSAAVPVNVMLFETVSAFVMLRVEEASRVPPLKTSVLVPSAESLPSESVP